MIEHRYPEDAIRMKHFSKFVSASFELCRPVGKQKKYPALTLTVIHAQERTTPKRRKTIEWKLQGGNHTIADEMDEVTVKGLHRIKGVAGKPINTGSHQEMCCNLLGQAKQLIDVALAITNMNASSRGSEKVGRLP
ncbi:hypothetical protein ACVWYQ_003208 [Bradyrhizobium sp. USDA 3397]